MRRRRELLVLEAALNLVVIQVVIGLLAGFDKIENRSKGENIVGLSRYIIPAPRPGLMARPGRGRRAWTVWERASGEITDPQVEALV